MSRSKDTLAVLKGLQLVIKAAVRTNDEYSRHLWSNSFVKDILAANCSRAKQFTDRLATAPNQEFENVTHFLKETVERSSVVAESIYRLGVTQSPALGKFNEMAQRPMDSVNKVREATQFPDISAITLKELEQYLSNKYDRVDKHYPDAASENVENSVERDEKYMKEWMHFIAEHKVGENATESPLKSVESTKISSPPTSANDNNSNVTRNLESQTQPSVEIPLLSTLAKQRKVPSSRFGRMASFGTLFAGLGIGTINELTKGALGLGGSTDAKSALFSQKNAERIVDTLCRVRGAALKLGQILSIQDSSIVSPHLAKAFDRVRQAADYMPDWQVEQVMKQDFGANWRDQFKQFDEKPFAAASIGQVHRGIMADGMEVAVKIQYPGVAQSIESDIDNLVGILKVWDVFPPGIFIDNVVKVAKRELVWEVDYLREANYTEKFGEMVAQYPEYYVPKVRREVTTKNILTTELIPGVPLDKCFEMR